MRLRIAPKIVIRVSAVLTLSASLVYASVSRVRNEGHEVNTGSALANQESDGPPNNTATEDDGQGHIDSVIVIKPK